MVNSPGVPILLTLPIQPLLRLSRKQQYWKNDGKGRHRYITKKNMYLGLENQRLYWEEKVNGRAVLGGSTVTNKSGLILTNIIYEDCHYEEEVWYFLEIVF